MLIVPTDASPWSLKASAADGVRRRIAASASFGALIASTTRAHVTLPASATAEALVDPAMVAEFRLQYPYEKPMDMVDYVKRVVPRAGNPQKVLQAMEDFASVYPMYACGRRKAGVLGRVLKEDRSKNLLEIGSFFGFSALTLALAMPGDAHLTCLEGSEANIEVMHAILQHALESGSDVLKRVDIIAGLSSASIAAMPSSSALFDFVYFDHDKDCYLKDLKLLESNHLLAGRCTLVADNVIFPGAPDYLDYLSRNARWSTHIEKMPFERKGFETQFKEREDGMSISKSAL